MNDSKLAQDIGHLGGLTATADILGGAYEFPAEIDRITTELVKFIHDLAHKYSTPSMSPKIRIQQYKKLWVTCRDKLTPHTRVYTLSIIRRAQTVIF